jgi:translation elongation factor EF-Ts
MVDLPPLPTADEVRALREQTGAGLVECKRILQRRWLAEAIERSETIDDLKAVLRVMTDL